MGNVSSHLVLMPAHKSGEEKFCQSQDHHGFHGHWPECFQRAKAVGILGLFQRRPACQIVNRIVERLTRLIIFRQ